MRYTTKPDERLNSLTHGLGALLALAGLVMLLVLSVQQGGDPWKIVSFSIYGSSLVVLFAASMLYHGVQEGRIKAVFQKLDHSAIYVLIAGTYTPFTLVAMRGPWGWSVFAIIWALAIAGVLFQIFFYDIKYRKVSAILYVAMAWIIVIALGPLIRSVPAAGLFWLLAGGVFYNGGVYFYLKKQKPFFHVIWHLFVLAGAAFHFIAIFQYILPL